LSHARSSKGADEVRQVRGDIRPFAQSARLALLTVLRQRRRTSIAIAAVSVGVIALVIAQGFIEWIFWATREGTIQSGLGHIHVARQGFQERGSTDLRSFLMPADAPALAELRSTPGVAAVAPRLFFSGLASHGDNTLSFLAEGVDPQSESNFGEINIIVSGQNLAADRPKEVTVGAGLAANLGVRIGDTIVLLVNTPNGGINATEARVRGIFATISKAYDDSAVRVPLPLAMELTRVKGAHLWVLVLKDTESTQQILASLRQRLSGRGLELVPWYDLADFYNKTVSLLARQLGFVKVIIGLIIVLTIVNSMMMGVMERTSEIGTTLALGASQRRVLFQFLVEGAVLGLAGAALGVVVGSLLAEAISAVGIPMPPPPGQSQGYRARIIVTPPAALAAFGIATASAIIAAAYPAWKASRTNIVDALRHNR